MGSVVIALLIAACVGLIQLYKTNIPEHVDRSTIDVTQSEYDQALQKWRARGASEYEFSIHSGSEDIRLHVPGTSGPADVLQHLHLGSGVDEENLPQGSGRLRRMTIESLFEDIKEGIDVSAIDSSFGSPNSKNNLFYDYSARFNPELGYPTYYSSYLRVTRPSREIVWRSTLDAPVEVTDVKIIR
ncbi:MAG TPA: hypothetical protein VJ183_02265 [Chloroflexia bacterium]|nr:hypothetical protein [Chloroflexia bacterium]